MALKGQQSLGDSHALIDGSLLPSAIGEQGERRDGRQDKGPFQCAPRLDWRHFGLKQLK
jgi:hypothetical protein